MFLKKRKEFCSVLTKAAINNVGLCVPLETVYFSYTVLSCLVLSCHVMSCLVLSCHVLPGLFSPSNEVQWCMHVNIIENIQHRIQPFLCVVVKATRGIFLQNEWKLFLSEIQLGSHVLLNLFNDRRGKLSTSLKYS